MSTTNRARHCVSVLILVLAAPAAGAEVAASIDAGVGYSDNITRTSGEQIDETLGTLGVLIRAERPEGRLVGLFNADLEYISYLDDTYDDDVYGRVDLNGDYWLVQDTFSWALEDSWGQIRRDPFEVPNPGNTENTNYFATGPDFIFRFGQRTNQTLTGRWADTSYEETARDFQRLGGGLALSRAISERTTIGLHGYASRVEFDDPLYGSDYDAQEYYGRIATEGARTRVEFDAGYTEVHDQGESSGNPLFRLSVTRDISPKSALTLEAGTEVSDSGQLFQGIGDNGGAPGFGNPSDVIGIGDPFERRYFGLRWSTDGQRGRFGLGANYRQELYETQTQFDRDVTEFYADYSRGLTEALRLSLGARYEMEEYDDGSYDEDRLRLAAGLAWDVSGKVFVSADYEFYQSDSSSPLQDYDENRLWVRVGYRAR